MFLPVEVGKMLEQLAKLIQSGREAAAPGYEDWVEQLIRAAFELADDAANPGSGLAELTEEIRKRLVI